MAKNLQEQDSRDCSTSDNKPPAHQKHSTNREASTSTTKTSRLARLSSSAAAFNAASRRPPPVALTTAPIPIEGQIQSAAVDKPGPNRYPTSKVFISKCRTELESLLDSIKQSYNNEIKTLYSEESYTDLFVEIGSEFSKPLHRCILASRAFKFYNTLKAFKLIEIPAEEDIIVSDFQAKKEAPEREKENLCREEGGDNDNCSQPEPEEIDVNLIDGVEKGADTVPIHFNLPEGLLSPELLLNFLRRVYLDEDITEEETQLNRSLIIWIKTNKPELIKIPKPVHSPNHRESFRTVQPNFDESESQSSIKSPTMSPEHNINLFDDNESAHDDLEETSQATSIKDESLTSSLLTRTETFELISKSNPGSPSVNINSPNKKTSLEGDTEGNVGGEVSNTEDSNTPTPYVPTTRTGLKPKTFTTPRGLRTITSAPAGKKQTQAPSKPNAGEPDGAKTKTTATRTSVGTQPSSSSNETPSVTKRSSQLPENTPDAQSSKQVSSKVKTITSVANKTGKPTLIARAHPISMERSQSPGTNTIKGSGRNFIAANKRLISQIEKKMTPSPSDHVADDSEPEVNDTNSFVLEPLTSDNLIAQMDKCTLISYSRLADALSGLFIQGKLSDAIIQVKDGKQINVHKCVIAARSAYLAEYITKQSLPLTTSESLPGNVRELLKIDLTAYTYPAVYFCIMHIYSGIVKVPEDLDLDELTKLSHLLHVPTLTQVCVHNLKMDYCHFFHKPCNACCLGVLKTLPLAWRYDYTELYSKCLQWIGSNFANIFCLREFSELKPHDLLEECYSATLSQLTPDNIIPKTIECQRLLKNLPRVKWTESIVCLVGRLLEDFCHYVADNYEKILQSDSFLNLGKNCWECEILEENLLAAMNHLKPDSGCKTLIQLHKIECSNETYCDEPSAVSDSFANLIFKMRKYCERYLLKDAATVVHCSSWRHMNPSLQKRIRDQAVISADFDEPTKQLSAKPKLPSMSRVTNQQHSTSSHGNSSSSDGTRSPSNRSTPDSKLKSPNTYLPPMKNKPASACQVKVLK